MVDVSVSQQLVHSTVRIEGETVSGDVITGTAFFFAFDRPNNAQFPVLVTNRHVVQGIETGRFQLTHMDSDGMPLIGTFSTHEFKGFEGLWTPHPEIGIDLCAMPVGQMLQEEWQKGNYFYFRKLEPTHILNDEELQELTAVEQVVAVGYPVGIWDSTNNMPIVRRGITATHPAIRFEGEDRFLIDTPVFTGSSGSPVFLFNEGGWAKADGDTVIGTRVRLLGILSGGYSQSVGGTVRMGAIPVTLTSVPMNLGVALQAKKILDFDVIFKARTS